MQTGEIANKAGLYQCACCHIMLVVASGEKLPPCSICGAPRHWSLVRALGPARWPPAGQHAKRQLKLIIARETADMLEWKCSACDWSIAAGALRDDDALLEANAAFNEHVCGRTRPELQFAAPLEAARK